MNIDQKIKQAVDDLSRAQDHLAALLAAKYPIGSPVGVTMSYTQKTPSPATVHYIPSGRWAGQVKVVLDKPTRRGDQSYRDVQHTQLTKGDS